MVDLEDVAMMVLRAAACGLAFLVSSLLVGLFVDVTQGEHIAATIFGAFGYYFGYKDGKR